MKLYGKSEALLPRASLFPSVAYNDSLDWKDYGVDSILNTVLNHKHLGNGSIILCHNGAKYTASALEQLITSLKEKGFTFVTMSELIYKDNYAIDVEGRQHQKNTDNADSPVPSASNAD